MKNGPKSMVQFEVEIYEVSCLLGVIFLYPCFFQCMKVYYLSYYFQKLISLLFFLCLILFHKYKRFNYKLKKKKKKYFKNPNRDCGILNFMNNFKKYQA